MEGGLSSRFDVEELRKRLLCGGGDKSAVGGGGGLVQFLILDLASSNLFLSALIFHSVDDITHVTALFLSKSTLDPTT